MIEFYKMHGAGNDFIVIPSDIKLSTDEINSLCTRHTGVGADGLIIISKHTEYDFSMKYYNADGIEADMCGNGGRCAVLLAYKLGWISDKNIRFIAKDGEHYAEILGDEVKIKLTKPKYFISLLQLDCSLRNFSFINTGVEHLVTFSENIDDIDVEKEGRACRYSNRFENGTNVNFATKQDNKIYIRTYERGVEGETLACGTGASAVAYTDMIKNNDFSEREVITKGGKLVVSFENDALWLQGPALVVYKGII